MAGSVPCANCGLPVPPGRLACPSCGTLVASVANGTAPAATADPTVARGPAIERQPEPEPEAAVALRAGASSPPAEAIDVLLASDGVASGGIVPGSYLPPSTVHVPASASMRGPSTMADTDTSRAMPSWFPPGPPVPNAGLPPAVATTSSPPPAPSGGSGGRPLTAGRSSILADLPFDAPDELEGWLVALGGGLAILGFFLPWTSSLDPGIEGYFSSWGLGIGAHLPIFVFLVVVTALAVLPNRVATWVRTGVCGMVGGGILFGVVWLYLGSDASQLGALLAAVGAILMVAGGIISVAPGRASRHEVQG